MSVIAACGSATAFRRFTSARLIRRPLFVHRQRPAERDVERSAYERVGAREQGIRRIDIDRAYHGSSRYGVGALSCRRDDLIEQSADA